MKRLDLFSPGTEFFTSNDRVDEFAKRVVLFSGFGDDVLDEFLVAKPYLPAECVFDQALCHSGSEVILPGYEDIAQLEIVAEFGTVVKLAGRIDRPGLFLPRHGFAIVVGHDVGVFGSPGPDCIEVFQAHADGVDAAVAARALRFLLMSDEPFAGSQNFS